MSAPPPSGRSARTPAERPHRNLALGFVALLLAAALAAAPASAQDPVPTADRGEAAAGWLARQLVDGERMEVDFGGTAFPDYGATIDAVLGFAAAGVADEPAAAATAWLAQSGNTEAYIGDGTDEAYAGPTAKLALLAQVRGLDATSFGDVDLIERLEGLEEPSGRFSDQSAFGDFSNSIGQSFAIIALHRQSGTSPSTESVDLLLESQCGDGGFALALEPDPGDCLSGPDTTAFAVQALLAVGGHGAAVADALDHLVATQGAAGGFEPPGPEGPNANSTGLAAQALAAGGRDDAAAAAAQFVLALQQGCDAAEQDRGAIAYDESGFDQGTAPRATSQGLFALAPVGLAELGSGGAAPGAPLLDCPAPATPPPPASEEQQPAPGEPAPTAGGGAGGPAPAAAPAATAVAAAPAFTG